MTTLSDSRTHLALYGNSHPFAALRSRMYISPVLPETYPPGKQWYMRGDHVWICGGVSWRCCGSEPGFLRELYFASPRCFRTVHGARYTGVNEFELAEIRKDLRVWENPGTVIFCKRVAGPQKQPSSLKRRRSRVGHEDGHGYDAGDGALMLACKYPHDDDISDGAKLCLHWIWAHPSKLHPDVGKR